MCQTDKSGAAVGEVGLGIPQPNLLCSLVSFILPPAPLSVAMALSRVQTQPRPVCPPW